MADFEAPKSWAETSAADLALRGPPRAFCVSFALCRRASVRASVHVVHPRLHVRTYIFILCACESAFPCVSSTDVPFSIAECNNTECKHRTAEGIFCSVSIQQDVQLSRPDLNY